MMDISVAAMMTSMPIGLPVRRMTQNPPKNIQNAIAIISTQIAEAAKLCRSCIFC